MYDMWGYNKQVAIEQDGKYLAYISRRNRKKIYIQSNTGPILKLFIGRGDDDNDN